MNTERTNLLRRIAVGVLLAAAAGVAALALLRTGRPGEKQMTAPQPPEVDTDLLAYRRDGRFETGICRPVALTTAEGRVYVAGDRDVVVYSPAGNELSRWDMPAAPTCVATDEAGRVLVGLGDRVGVYDRSGEQQAYWPSVGDDAEIVSIAPAGDDVFLADWRGKRVLRCGRGGRVKDVITNEANGGFRVPSPYFDVAVAPDGLLRVANTGRQEIVAFTFAGERRFGWGRQVAAPGDVEGFHGCCNPAHFIVAPDGRLVTAEKSTVSAKVKVYAADDPETHVGAVEAVVMTAEDLPDATMPLDVALDAKERVLVLELAPAGRVHVFAPTAESDGGNE